MVSMVPVSMVPVSPNSDLRVMISSELLCSGTELNVIAMELLLIISTT